MYSVCGEVEVNRWQPQGGPKNRLSVSRFCYLRPWLIPNRKMRAQLSPSLNLRRRCAPSTLVHKPFPQSLIYTALYRLLCQTMANREMQQANMQNSSSPQPLKRGTDSPALEHSPANKDSPAPPPQQSPAAEQAEGAGEGSEKAPAEMTLDITSFRKPGEKTFTQRSRLFIGNVPLDMPEEEFKNMFAKYGNVNEVFINRDRGFGFVRLVWQSSVYRI